MSGVHTGIDGKPHLLTPQKRGWTRYATTDGTGVVAGGNNEASIDLSTADDYYIEASGEILLVARVIVMVQDTSFTADKYGTITLNAGEGVSIVVERDGVEVEDLSGGVAIGSVGDWAGQCHDVNLFAGFAQGDAVMSARYTFTKHGEDAAIRLQSGDKLIFRVHGDFGDLTHHRFLCEGVYEWLQD